MLLALLVQVLSSVRQVLNVTKQELQMGLYIKLNTVRYIHFIYPAVITERDAPYHLGNVCYYVLLSSPDITLCRLGLVFFLYAIICLFQLMS